MSAVAVPLNHVPACCGQSRAVCSCCSLQSRPVAVDGDGEPDLWHMARGWSQAPFPAHYRHADGSMGSTYTCPACNGRLHRGESLRRRQYLTPPQASSMRAASGATL